MDIKPDTTVGEIVSMNFRTAQLFDKNNIDFCCGGNITLEQACKKSAVDMNRIIPEIEEIVRVNDPDSIYIDRLPLDELADYIEKRHHSFVNENLTFIQEKLQKLCDVHGSHHPELFEIKSHFEKASGNLTLHMKNEELMLFPYVKELVLYNANGGELPKSLGQAKGIIEEMTSDHEAGGERFELISKLSDQYTCPPDGCNTFRITYQSLKDFEDDLHRHIHLESNVLFKKMVVLEAELLERSKN
jgi:regulator of cell morphogenesis and NO signaling